jgi:hypothetical protein
LTVKASANAYLTKLAKPKEPQKSGYAESLTAQAGRVMIAERMWLVTQRAISVVLPDNALSNVWWPARLKVADQRREKALVLWLNSSLGALLMIAHRVPTRGPWISFKKPTLEEVPVFDVLALSEPQLLDLETTFDDVADRELEPFAHIASDETRARVDAAFARVLALPDLHPLAEMLGREPIITNSPIVPETEAAAGFASQERLSLL